MAAWLCGRLTKLPERLRRSISPVRASSDIALFTVMREHSIFGRQFMLEGDAVAGRPFARQDAAANVGQDALVERRLAVLAPPFPRP